MAFKLNIGDKGMAWRIELESEALLGKKIGDKVEGKEIKPEFDGYEFEITGTSDKAGFPGMKEIDSPTLTKRLLKRGFGMKTAEPKGLRLRKTLRGGIISEDTMQINMKVLKHGHRKLSEIFPEQNKPKEEANKEEKKTEKLKEETKERVKEEKKEKEAKTEKKEEAKKETKEEAREEKKEEVRKEEKAA